MFHRQAVIQAKCYQGKMLQDRHYVTRKNVTNKLKDN